MATGKRYFWIKLKTDFLTSDSVDFLMSQPNGANYIVLYEMLCLKSINTDGRLASQVGEILLPYDIPKIRRDCKYFSEDTVRIALTLYKQLGMVYEQADGCLVIADFGDVVGSETDYAAQKRNQRAIRGQLTDSSVENVHTEIEKDIEIDKKENIKEKVDRDKVNDFNLYDAFDKIYDEYPKKGNMVSARRIFIELFVNSPKENHKAIAKDFWNAISSYIEDYKAENGENYQFLPRLDKFLTEDLEYWVRKSKQSQEG